MYVLYLRILMALINIFATKYHNNFNNIPILPRNNNKKVITSKN